MITLSVWGVIALTYDFATLVNLALNRHDEEASAVLGVAAVVNVVCFLLWCFS